MILRVIKREPEESCLKCNVLKPIEGVSGKGIDETGCRKNFVRFASADAKLSWKLAQLKCVNIFCMSDDSSKLASHLFFLLLSQKSMNNEIDLNVTF